MPVMSKYVTVSVKIPREMKERLEKMGAKPSKLLRKALEDFLMDEEIAKIERELREMHDVLSKISIEDVVKSIREDRESH